MLGLVGPSAAAASASSAFESSSLLAPDELATAPPGVAASVSLFVGDVAHTCEILPHPEGPSAVEHQAERMRARAQIAARTTSLRRATRTPIVCAAKRSDVAVIIAADIRLPPTVLTPEWIETIARRHRGGGRDGCNRTRAEVVHAINHFTNESDVFVHTDAAYQNDIPLFDHVVASRLTEEDGGNPATANSGNRGGLYVQWWRLSRAWNLLVEYEEKCAYAHEGKEYKFIMKMRTDMNLYGDWKLATLYRFQVVPRFSERTAFMSSDRFFGGSRKVFRHMANFEKRWRELEERGFSGVCGTCSMVCGVSRRIKLTPGFSQVSLEGQAATCDRGCFHTEQYSNGVVTPEWKKFCSVYRSELDDDLSAARGHLISCGHVPQHRPGEARQACILGGGSEKTFAYHVLRGNYSVRGFSELDQTLWSRQHAELMVWRHMVHMFDDGFTIDDGPLQSLEDIGNARTFVNLERHVSAQVSAQDSTAAVSPPNREPASHGRLVNCRAPTLPGGNSEDVMFMLDRRRGRYSSA
mgnify:FL=1